MILINGQKGFALPLVLGITAMILIMILAVSDSVSRKIRVVSELNSHAKAELKAVSGYNQALYTLLVSTYTPTGLQVHGPPDSGISGMPEENGSSALWNLYGKPIELGPDMEVEMRDTAGMVSPLFPSDLLRRIMERTADDPDQPQRALAALSDWQDSDDLKRLNGAEARDYRSEGLSYTPRNAYVQSVSELYLVKNFDPGLIKNLEDHLVYWPSGDTNYLTMPDDLLRAVLSDEEQAGRVIELRNQGRLTPSAFTSVTGIGQTMDNIFSPSGRIRITVTAESDTATSRIQAVVSKRSADGKPFTILSWKRQ